VPRGIRVAPFHARQQELGAWFIEGGGWERPAWYESNRSLLDGLEVPERDAWSARFWSPIAVAEHHRTRETVALFDMTPLKRIEVEGPGALEFLQRLTTNELDRRVGTVAYSLMLDGAGHIRGDVTVARLGASRFLLCASNALDVRWVLAHLPSGGSVTARDVTPGTCGIGVWGPNARRLVRALTDDDFSNEGFRYFRARETFVGGVPVAALRVSYVGELGWELYTTADLGLRLWEALWEAGRGLGVIAAGRRAFESLRLEKGYRASGVDMTGEHDPYEAGLPRVVRPDKGEFLGREALVRAAERPPARRLTCLTLNDPGAVVMGGEPVRAGGTTAGYVTSAAYAVSIGRGIAYAWLRSEVAVPGTPVEVVYFGRPLAGTVAEEPVFDPTGTRVRG
jgi:glycine cleavage system aminomethyltransferase T